jgi:hypothetical protein
MYYVTAGLQDWFLDYASGDWSGFPWSVAQFGRMFPSATRPKQQLEDFFSQAVADANSSLPIRALACQRLAAWNPAEARAVIRSAIQRIENAHSRRVMALAALLAGEQRSIVRRWLNQMDENRITVEMLEEHNFRPPEVVAEYAN